MWNDGLRAIWLYTSQQNGLQWDLMAWNVLHNIIQSVKSKATPRKHILETCGKPDCRTTTRWNKISGQRYCFYKLSLRTIIDPNLFHYRRTLGKQEKMTMCTCLFVCVCVGEGVGALVGACCCCWGVGERNIERERGRQTWRPGTKE